MSQSPRPQRATTAHDTTTPRATVLVVDDVPANLGVLYEYLDARGFQVLIAEDGESALEQASYARPDIILLDMMMPGIDGLETCRRLKSMEATREIPVIFMTALADTAHKVAGFQAGAVDYISKPFQQEEVVARIDTQVRATALQRELETHIDRLSASNAELDAFARTVAHDLKDPSAQIVGLAQLVQHELAELPDTPELAGVAAKVGLISQVGTQMARIIDELLLLSRVRHGEVEVGAVQDMDAVVNHALARLEHMIQERGARIDKTEIWPRALGHGPWLEEVWVNLISNAIKYGGSPPQVTLGATSLGDDRVRFWVRDNGAGVPDDIRPTIFQEFVQRQGHSADGHGLGLAIVKRIVDKLDGELGCDDLPDAGSSFHFTLPSAPA